MENITKEALVEELRNKMWGIEGDVRLNNREPDADLMIERFLHHLTTALDCYGTAQRAEERKALNRRHGELIMEAVENDLSKESPLRGTWFFKKIQNLGKILLTPTDTPLPDKKH